ENPKLREEILAMIKWWLDFGIDGFRLDAISHIKKMPFDVQMSDYDGDDIPGDKWQVHTNVTGFKNYLEMMKEVFDQYPIFTVGEASGVSSSQAQLWTGDDGYFKSIFELEQNVHDSTDSNGRPIGNLKVLKNTITEWQEALRLFGWMSPYLANHDNPRSLQTWGDNKTAHSAKALATVLLSLQGTPFVYFGDEIGIPSFDFKSIEEINDPEAHMGYENQVKAGRDPKEVFDGVKVWNRDQGRSPMQWNDSPNGGFSTGKPWMPVNPSFTSVNVENEIEDPDSIFNYYKRMIELRKEQTVLNEGEFSSLAKDDKSVCSFVRKTDDEIALVIANLTDGKTTFQLPEAIYSENWVRVIENAEFDLKKEIELNPWDAAIFKRALL
ncbi:MAG: alpha-glucosidase C-terminal domain-containing protein, partial [Lactobacillaceae bacterium]|nr:alpha-glucosidase C-terminal domain-containing protein [Lactobacillaceae bacterium]